MSNPTAEWEKIGDRFYRKIQLYTSIFDEDLELDNYHVVGAQYGGAIALYRDEKKLLAYRGTSAAKTSIDIYSSARKLIKSISWDKGSIKGLGWSEDEKLLVVTEDGTVRCYYDFGGDFTQFSLGNGAEDYGVRACRFWSTGFVALLSNNHLVSVSRYDEPRPSLLAIPPEGEVHSWTLISPENTLSRSVEVLLSIGSTIHVIDATESEDRMLQNGPFKFVSVSPNGKFAALYTEDGKLWVISSDFQQKLSEYDSRSKIAPKDVQWCGNNSVVLAWEDEVHMVGPNGAASKYYYDGRVHIIADIDGVRVLSNDVCEFLQKVPESTEEVFMLGSTSPASVLLDAADQLEKKSPKADSNMKLLRDNGTEADAVDTCIEAAGNEFSIHWQKQLLKAASFGKSTIDLYNSDEFVDMGETLRVLNAVRYYEIGIPISYDQYTRLGPERLVKRLINRREYLLALRISEYIHLPTEGIYIDWASQKVRVSAESEDELCRTVVEKLKSKPNISFESIARAANEEGRRNLATQLLNYEPRAGKQVPLLLSMDQDEIALDKAIESGDTDLIYIVLLQLKSKPPLASFFRTLNSRPVATALVETSALAQDQDLLKQLYYQDDRRLDGSNLLVLEALNSPTLASTLSKLDSASKLLADSKAHNADLRALDETARLLRVQQTLTKDLSEPFASLSLHETVMQLIRLGYSSRAKKLCSDFKLSEKTTWWLRLRALVAKRDWAELEDMGKARKSPIGWEPFFNEVLGAGNTKLASSFVPKCINLTPKDRVEMWVKCGLVLKAAEEAFKAKDTAMLDELRPRANAAQLGEIERFVGQLKRK